MIYFPFSLHDKAVHRPGNTVYLSHILDTSLHVLGDHCFCLEIIHQIYKFRLHFPKYKMGTFWKDLAL